MRILQWLMPFLPNLGGRENFVDDLSTALAQLGHDVIVFAQADRADAPPYELSATERGLTVHRFNVDLLEQPNAQQAFSTIATAMMSIAQEFSPDVIHFHNIEERDVSFIRIVARQLRVPTVYTLHNSYGRLKPRDQQNFTFISEFTTRYVAISQFVAEDFELKFPAERARLRCIENGVRDLGELPPPPTGPFRALAMGRLSPEKGFPVLLTAWSVIHERFPEATLVIAGDGQYRRALEHFSSHLGISDVVELPGRLSAEQLHAEQAKSHVVVVPSLWQEPFGLVAAEALMAGRPVIASRAGALVDIVRHRETGLLFNLGDIPELVASLVHLIENPDLTLEYGSRARVDALERFHHDRCVAEYVALYEEIRS
ncbi:MAG: glycosyltransferase family 4 protein [Microbacteriaceae bacterium]